VRADQYVDAMTAPVFVVTCADGRRRHAEPFPTRRDAVLWADMGHICMTDHHISALVYGFRGDGRIILSDWDGKRSFSKVRDCSPGVAYMARCTQWVRNVGTEYLRTVGPVMRGWAA
jgi:hypothetical protein